MPRRGRRADRSARAPSASRGSGGARSPSRRRRARPAPSARGARQRAPPRARADGRTRRRAGPRTRGLPSGPAYNRPMPTAELVQRYADLIVRVGLNLRAGEDLQILCHVEHAPFAREVAEVAYRAGARRVDPFYSDQHVHRSTLVHAADETLEWSPPWTAARVEHLHAHRGAELRISGDPNPDINTGIAGERIARARPKEFMKRYAEIIFDLRTVNWCGVAYPNEGWARSVFGEPDLERLWDLVARAVRLDEADPVAAWQAHLARLADRAARLNERNFDAVRF